MYTDYHAYNFRSRYTPMTEAEYLDNYQNRYEGLEVTSYNRSISPNAGKSVTETVEFTLQDRLAGAGDRLFLNPLVLFRMEANPFKLESRQYPIDYAYPWQEKVTFNIALPEGYQVTSVPEPAALSLAGDLGSFRYQIAHQGNLLQVVVQVAQNQAVIPAGYYAGIREFFDNIVQKESEQVVLTKM